MNKNLLILTFIGALIFSGCSKKVPVALPGSSNSGGGGQIIEEGGSSNLPSGDLSVAASKNSFQAGAVNSQGKYTGSDGVSKSGFKLLYFASDSYTLDDDQIRRLMSDIPRLKEAAQNGKLIVEGNCDEFGTDEYNHALGLKRAKTVKELLVSAGIDASKIDTVSYGESNPVCTVDKPACHAKNRRAEINKN